MGGRKGRVDSRVTDTSWICVCVRVCARARFPLLCVSCDVCRASGRAGVGVNSCDGTERGKEGRRRPLRGEVDDLDREHV